MCAPRTSAGSASTSVSRSATERVILAARGVVEVRLRYGSTGRPEHLYAIRA